MVSTEAHWVRSDPPSSAGVDFRSFRNRHPGEAMLVCGCGESIEHLQPPLELATIGVNDVGRWLDPTYLVVVNPEGQFSRERFDHIRNSRARAIFTQYRNLAVPADRRVLLRFGQYAGTDFSDPDVVHYTQNSPYVAVCLAIHMGASRVGLLGIDFGTRSVYCSSSVHPLAGQVGAINSEYARLAVACKAHGVELLNLSPVSRLTALPAMPLADFLRAPAPRPTTSRESSAPASKPAILIVDYDFVTCGRVFGAGLARAAASLGLAAQTILWNDPGLPALVASFKPDLMIVVHGRGFARRWGQQFRAINTAVWLLDEPYEVDDTARWSSCYNTVFVNDRSTLARHRNAHYLPVCYDAQAHQDTTAQRRYRVGFVGGASALRERYLTALATAGLLDYVVGGPWTSPVLRDLTLAQKTTPEDTARLYQSTQVIVNVFREVHHFNRDRMKATAVNPRIVEALACGALVVSERRQGLEEVVPELPQFDSAEELVGIVRRCLGDEERLAALKRQCRTRLNGHAYSDRLTTMLDVTLRKNGSSVASQLATTGELAGMQLPPGWLAVGVDLEPGSEASVVLRRPGPASAVKSGTEVGIVTDGSFGTVDLRATVRFSRDAVLVAKIHQLDKGDPTSNSYHLVATAAGSYLARQDQVLGRLILRPDTWIRLRLRWSGAWLEIWADDVLQGRFRDSVIGAGYCFLGLRAGTVALRSVCVEEELRPKARVIPIQRATLADGPPPQIRACHAGSVLEAPPQLELPPLGSATRRNLIYHIWPKHGSNWRWNIEQLLRRMELFNGKRVIGIVTDEDTEPAQAVLDLLADHGCDLVIQANTPAGEAISFPSLLRKVASTAPDEVTFYGHAKGVKYGLPCPPNVQRWTETLYRAALDDWPTVRSHLEHLGMTGSFRMPGRFVSHRNSGDWHYSGTFFWMRHAAVFARAWEQVQEFYYGVEAWPGSLFRRNETGCLFLDDLRPPLPYMDEFWRRRGNQAWREWEAGRRGVAPPADLATPKPFDGFTTPRLEHKPEELAWWLERLKSHGVRRLLTIGSTGGGVEWHTARVLRESGVDVEITTIEANPSAELLSAFEDARGRFGQPLHLLRGSPRHPDVRAQLVGPFDAVLVDGEHGYNEVRADFLLARSLGPKLIGLHDIVDSDWHAATGCCVSRLWRELAAECRTEAMSGEEWAGIGVVLV